MSQQRLKAVLEVGQREVPTAAPNRDPFSHLRVNAEDHPRCDDFPIVQIGWLPGGVDWFPAGRYKMSANLVASLANSSADIQQYTYVNDGENPYFVPVLPTMQ